MSATAAPARSRSPLVLLGFLAVTFVVAGLGSLATLDNVEGWYADADKPWFTPPNALFGPVWTVLYIAMAVAAWLVWRAPGSPSRTTALRLWWLQLALNLAWTPTFFAGELLWTGFAVIVLLDVAVAVTLVRFARISGLAGLLFVPYLAWVLYASALNAGIAALN